MAGKPSNRAKVEPPKSSLSGGLCIPPDKGGKGGLTSHLTKGGHVPYNQALTERARENRKNPTPAEKKMWFEILQNKRLTGLKFTRQKPLAQYIVDFYCADLMLAIEIDGDTHASHEDYDRQRTAELNGVGIEVIRYTNREIRNDIDGVYSDLSTRVKDILKKKTTP